MWYTEVGFEKRTRIGSWLHCRFNDVAFLRDKNAGEPHLKASGFVAVLGSDKWQPFDTTCRSTNRSPTYAFLSFTPRADSCLLPLPRPKNMLNRSELHSPGQERQGNTLWRRMGSCLLAIWALWIAVIFFSTIEEKQWSAHFCFKATHSLHPGVGSSVSASCYGGVNSRTCWHVLSWWAVKLNE